MNKLAITLAVTTAVALDVIVILGSGLPDSAVGVRLMAVAVPIMDLCLVTSSMLLGRILIARGFRALGILFLLNIVVFAVVVLMRLSGAIPPRWLLFCADVYWLNLYLVALSKTWPALVRQSAA